MNTSSIASMQDLTTYHKTLYTLTLLVLGVAYLFAMLQIVFVHADRDGSPWLSPQDLALAYSGNQNNTRLEAAIKGPMSGMLNTKDLQTIESWIKNGASQSQYDNIILPLMAKRCFSCHGNNSEAREQYPHTPLLQGYDNIMKLVKLDNGTSIATLIRVSHIHLFGMTFIFFIMGAIFHSTEFQSQRAKVIIMATPFIAILIDIFSWYLTKIYQPFSWIIYFSGILMALSFSIQWSISMYQMWFYTSKNNTLNQKKPFTIKE